jgi:hypothetical protein
MDRWPQITEPLLRERQGMSNEEFFEFLVGLLAAMQPELEEAPHRPGFFVLRVRAGGGSGGPIWGW